MSEREIFEYLRDNIKISIQVSEVSNYGNSPECIEVSISLRNPETDEFELISQDWS
jgi:hypothetical protein